MTRIAMAVDDDIALLPRDWRRSLGRFKFEPVERGMSGASLFRLADEAGSKLYLKIVQRPQLSEFRIEVERTRWLASQNVRAPAYLEVFDDGSVGAALMTALPGRHPHAVSGPIRQTVRALARGLSALHAIPAKSCPFDESTHARLARADEMIKRGLVSAETFCERNQGLTPEAIYERLKAAIPEEEDLVVIHGDATFDNLLVDENGIIGFIDCGHCGRGDRYVDLATIIEDLQEDFGSDAIALFGAAYRIELNEMKLQFFADLYELF